MTSVKRGLTGEKVRSTDEFFIKKKDPLILPPNYESLPRPSDIEEVEEALSIKKKLVENSSSDINSNERSILDQIKNK
jgi:intein/homing endonuclease